MPFWVAQLQFNRERVALHFLAQAGYTTYAPRLREWRRRSGRRVGTAVPLFPNYCFIAVQLQWSRACSCPGVIRLVRGGDQPARVSDMLIEAIRQRERRGAVELPKQGLRRGDRVRVMGGPFEGRLGLYEGQAPHERVLVLLSWLGAERQIELAMDDVEAI